MPELKLKDYDYNEQRKFVRSYNGPLNEKIAYMQNNKVSNIMNLIKIVDVMKTIISDKTIKEYIDKAVKEAQIAFEVIRNENGDIIGLNELDVATIHPIVNSTSEMGWTQHMDSKTVKEFKHDDILYISLHETFEDVINLLN